MKFKRERNKTYDTISSYVIFTSVAIFILYRIALHFDQIMLGIGHGIVKISTILTPVFAGFFLAYLLKPVVTMLERKLFSKSKDKNPMKVRRKAVTITWLTILVTLIILCSLIVSVFTKEFQIINFDTINVMLQDLGHNFNSFYQDMMKELNQLSTESETLKNLTVQISSWLGSFTQDLGNNIMNSASHFTGALANTFFAIIFSIYFLADEKRIKAYWKNVFVTINSKKTVHNTRIFLKDADKAFSGYIRGQLLDAVLMAVLIAITLSILNIKFAVIIGILAGIGNLIPYVGPFVAYGLTTFVCILQGDMSALVKALIGLAVIQGIDGQIINPKLLGNAIEIHPMFVIVALIIGENIGGFAGMIFAVPIAALIKIEFDRYIAYKKKTSSN